jgi:predicted nicotinamide N-methyase
MALQFALHNARLNRVTLEAVASIDWRRPDVGTAYDRVYAADVLYQLVDHAPLLTCIDALLAPGGTAVVVDPNRGVADRFAEMAQKAGFAVAVHPSAAPDHQERLVAGRIHVLRRR